MPSLRALVAFTAVLLQVHAAKIPHPAQQPKAPGPRVTAAPALPAHLGRRQYSGSGSSGGDSNPDSSPGYTPPDSGSGYTPPDSGSGYTPPDSDSGYTPPANGYTPPANGYTPPSNGYSTALSSAYGYGNSGSSQDPLCVPEADPDQGQGQSCSCSGATALLPTMTGSNMCGYTSLPSPSPSPTPGPSTTFLWTDTAGVVYACPSTSVIDVGVGPITECAGSSSAVSTVSSMAAQASQAAEEASFDIQACYWSSSYAGAAIKWAVLVPIWAQSSSVSQSNNDFRGSLYGSSACDSFSGYNGYQVGLYNTTLAATFSTDIFCTAYDMTNIIKATTGNAQSTACEEWGSDSGGVDPDPSDLIPELFEGAEDGPDIELIPRDDERTKQLETFFGKRKTQSKKAKRVARRRADRRSNL